MHTTHGPRLLPGPHTRHGLRRPHPLHSLGRRHGRHRFHRLPHFLRRRPLPAICLLVFTFQLAVLLAPRWATRTGVAAEAQANNRASAGWRGFRAYFNSNYGVWVARVNSATPDEDFEGYFTLQVECLEALQGYAHPGDSRSLPRSLRAPDPGQTILVGFDDRMNPCELAVGPFDLPDPWSDDPCYSALKFMRVHETDPDADRLTAAVLAEFQRLDHGHFFSDGRAYLWEALWGFKDYQLRWFTADGRPTALTAELARVVREELTRRPNWEITDQQARLAFHDRDGSAEARARLPQQMIYQLACDLQRAAARAATPEMNSAWLDLIEVHRDCLACFDYFVLDAARKPTYQAFFGRRIQHWLQEYLAHPTDSRAGVNYPQLLVSYLHTLGYAEAAPELEQLLATDGTRQLRGQIAELLYKFEPARAWSVIEPVLQQDPDNADLAAVLYEHGDAAARVAVVARLVSANARQVQQVVRCIPSWLREDLFATLVDQGRTEFLNELPAQDFHYRNRLALAVQMLNGDDLHSETACLALSTASGATIDSAAAWETWYQSALTELPVPAAGSPQDAEFATLLSELAAPAQAQRDQAWATFTARSPAALPTLARAAQADPRLPVRQVARALLRELPPDVHALPPVADE